jgi:metal-responsive CopG/Arc/MetJ family transcriptional regulator
MPDDEFQQVMVRLPREMVQRVDERRGRAGGLSRTEWFRRAVEFALKQPPSARLTETVERKI